MALAAAGKIAASYAIAKGKKHAYAAGKKIVKKGIGIAKKAVSKKAKKYLGEEGMKAAVNAISSNPSRGKVSDAPPSKVHKEMISKGMIKEKGTQEGAYQHGSIIKEKEAAAANRMQSHPTRKLLKENRALTYGGEATMKTRR